MPRPAHFEIHSENPERAITFYQGMFGWKFEKWPGPMDYWLIVTGPPEEPGINGGLLRRHGAGPGAGQPVNAFPCTISVASVDTAMITLEKLGGKVALPKMTVTGVGWLAYGIDLDGNIFGMMQADATAR